MTTPSDVPESLSSNMTSTEFKRILANILDNTKATSERQKLKEIGAMLVDMDGKGLLKEYMSTFLSSLLQTLSYVLVSVGGNVSWTGPLAASLVTVVGAAAMIPLTTIPKVVYQGAGIADNAIRQAVKNAARRRRQKARQIRARRDAKKLNKEQDEENESDKENKQQHNCVVDSSTESRKYPEKKVDVSNNKEEESGNEISKIVEKVNKRQLRSDKRILKANNKKNKSAEKINRSEKATEKSEKRQGKMERRNRYTKSSVVAGEQGSEQIENEDKVTKPITEEVKEHHTRSENRNRQIPLNKENDEFSSSKEKNNEQQNNEEVGLLAKKAENKGQKKQARVEKRSNRILNKINQNESSMKSLEKKSDTITNITPTDDEERVKAKTHHKRRLRAGFRGMTKFERKVAANVASIIRAQASIKKSGQPKPGKYWSMNRELGFTKEHGMKARQLAKLSLHDSANQQAADADVDKNGDTKSTPIIPVIIPCNTSISQL